MTAVELLAAVGLSRSVAMQPGESHVRLTRREMLRRGGMGFGSLGLAQLLAGAGLFETADAAAAARPLAPKQPHFAAKAKHVIHIFANGGPSHVNTFDPKPESLGGTARSCRSICRPSARRAPRSPRPTRSRNTARAASRSASCSATWPSRSTTSQSFARCMATRPTTSRR